MWNNVFEIFLKLALSLDEMKEMIGSGRNIRD